MTRRFTPPAAIGVFAVEINGRHLTTQALWDRYVAELRKAEDRFPDADDRGLEVHIDMITGSLSIRPAFDCDEDGGYLMEEEPEVEIVSDYVFKNAVEAARFINHPHAAW